MYFMEFNIKVDLFHKFNHENAILLIILFFQTLVF